ncbi:hypothetical protein [Sphingobacterium yanglingense]|uniref:Uncharacterized protein n=1 Tax=Sphingobacterium yanglingense TaxID=1437280 RepID=A0A4R6WMY0_9SPHI|nr:hypothetical protein [Sphingobacterium yanglingense]TDQ80142.1 hypothetical protein CLV99_1597 [Sphingobacterium yanglingense]
MKNQIKKLVNTVLFGAAILGGAITMQSFSEKEVSGHLVNKGSGRFELRSSVNPMNCTPTEPTACTYQILSPENIPTQDSYTESELATFEANGWISPSSSNGVYQN